MMFSEVADSAVPPPQVGFEVYADVFDTLFFFLGLSSQWQMAVGQTMAMRVGLRDEAVESNMNMYNIPAKKRPKLLQHIKAMERAALKVFAEKAEAQAKAAP